MDKLLVITGPTATGKTRLGISLALKLNGEIISADSRQVYKFMDIGTGKDIDKSKFKIQRSKIQIKKSRKREFSAQSAQNQKLAVGFYEIVRVKIWGLDLVKPDYPFNVSDFYEYATGVIKDIRARGKLPIVVGGTGLYIKALLEPFETLNIPPDMAMRNKLLSYPVIKLQNELQSINKRKWLKMNESDRNNPRRLVRAIEITLFSRYGKGTKYPPPESPTIEILKSPSAPRSDTLIIGLTAPLTELYDRIDTRVEKRIQEGMEEEVKNLIKKGYGWDLPAMSGLGYRDFRNYELRIQNTDLSTEDAVKITDKWKLSERHYAKRQQTYQKKYLAANWFDITQADYPENVFTRVEKWYHGTNHGQETGQTRFRYPKK